MIGGRLEVWAELYVELLTSNLQNVDKTTGEDARYSRQLCYIAQRMGEVPGSLAGPCFVGRRRRQGSKRLEDWRIGERDGEVKIGREREREREVEREREIGRERER